MSLPISVMTLITCGSVLVWAWLLLARGGFWKMDVVLQRTNAHQKQWPDVAVIIPARDESDVLPETLPAFLNQDYLGEVRVFLVDDQSQDNTSATALNIARVFGKKDQFTLINGEPLIEGWAGKVWALYQGIREAEGHSSEFLLLTDADIMLDSHSLNSLVDKAQREGLDLVSVMAQLRVDTMWDRFLLPAYVLFFAKLYPFRWSNNSNRSTAAAAGGCMLVRREALSRAGGMESIAGDLIDDCALAHRLKRHCGLKSGKIWLGLTKDVSSRRRYGSISSLWDLVARTAFAQLKFSASLLVVTVLGMFILYIAPPVAMTMGTIMVLINPGYATIGLLVSGLIAWLLMAYLFLPVLRWYNVSSFFAFLLPVAGGLYTAMTVASALRWWKGQGGKWKGRVYEIPTGRT